MKIEFSKYEAAGNDIIIFECAPNKFGRSRAKLKDFLRWVTHRNFGVGGDEVAFLQPAKSIHNTIRVSFFNSDGSRARICVNGLRCVAAYLYEKKKCSGTRSFNIETDSGSKSCRIISSCRGVVSRVEVDMGRAFRLDGTTGEPEKIELKIESKLLTGIGVSMGNPHLVFFDKLDPDKMQQVGQKLQKHRLLPGGINVGFASVRSSRKIDLVVWERGCGFTLSCGSGACAAVAAATALGKCECDAPVEVHMPGGTIEIVVRKSDRGIVMSGPTKKVFHGVLEIKQ